ncbi:TIGR03086 family metal-binding protein [Amycolatopsis sp. NPDC001319]|uniref:TIGR03086 family metal-binding protein n=1 Tax=unclassified Amycolatopsis TaxID=2618356 RepID=UPI003690BCBE
MTDHSALLRPAAAEFLRVAAAAQPLTAPTPCTGYDVRGLLNHLLYWGPWLAAAGRRETYLATGTEADVDLVGEGWLATLEKQTQDLVDAFASAAAWDGLATLGSATMPAAIVGDMVLGEFVIHGWDLARGRRDAELLRRSRGSRARVRRRHGRAGARDGRLRPRGTGCGRRSGPRPRAGRIRP